MGALPSFNEFKKSANMDAMAYDFEQAVRSVAEKSGEEFTLAQLSIITQCCVATTHALLQSYHEWLSETLQP